MLFAVECCVRLVLFQVVCRCCGWCCENNVATKKQFFFSPSFSIRSYRGHETVIIWNDTFYWWDIAALVFYLNYNAYIHWLWDNNFDNAFVQNEKLREQQQKHTSRDHNTAFARLPWCIIIKCFHFWNCCCECEESASVVDSNVNLFDCEQLVQIVFKLYIHTKMFR